MRPRAGVAAVGGEEVGDDHAEAAAGLAAVQGGDGGGEVAGRGGGAGAAPVVHGLGVQDGLEQGVHGGLAGAGGPAAHAVGVQQVGIGAVAEADGEEPDGGEGGDREVAFDHGLGAEVHAGGEVDQGPGFEFVVGDEVADVGVVVRAVTAQSMCRTSSSPGW